MMLQDDSAHLPENLSTIYFEVSVSSYRNTYGSSNTITCAPPLPHNNYHKFPVKSELSLRILFNTMIQVATSNQLELT